MSYAWQADLPRTGMKNLQGTLVRGPLTKHRLHQRQRRDRRRVGAQDAGSE